MPTVTKTPITLTNPNNDPTVERFIDVLGDKLLRIDEFYSKDDVETSYEFLNKAGDEHVAVEGDNSIGAVTGAYMNDGNLIAICNFGDDGNLHYCVNSHTRFLIIKDL